MKVYVKFLLNMFMKVEKNLLLKMNIKIKLNFFSHNKLNIQPRT